MPQQLHLWQQLITTSASHPSLNKALWYTAFTLSNLLKMPLAVSKVDALLSPLPQFEQLNSDLDAFEIGIHLHVESDLPAAVLGLLTLPNALHLVDRMMEIPDGTTTELGELELSALAEFGNITLTSLLNALSSFIGKSMRPSPPVVITNLNKGLIKETLLSPGITEEDLFTIKASFSSGDDTLAIHLWIIPENPSQ